MIVKADWSYDEFPELADIPKGAKVIHTTGDEIGIRQHYNVVYANVDGVELHLQILYPASRNEKAYNVFRIRPCIVFVQGSAWFEQDLFHQIPMVAKLAEKGYVIAVVEYRHSGIASFPAQAIDARNAVRYMRIHAEEYHIDPEKIIISGDSSGGHTAMFAGLIHDDDSADNLFPGVSAEVKGIVNYYGSTSIMAPDSNPCTTNHCLPDSPEGQVMGGRNLLENPDLMKKLSVEENIYPDTDIAPVLIFHGSKDRTVNATGSVVLYHKLKECGKDVTFYLIEGADHGGSEFWMPEVLDIVDSFIKNCLK